jgi:hypothetical protein
MDIIEKYYADHSELLDYLTISHQTSLQLVAQESFRRSLVLSIGSYFESNIKKLIEEFVKIQSANCPELISLVRITAVERQYHTLFDWDDKKINKFLSFFGADFKAKCATEIAANTELTDSARAFMQLGTLRNVIVHQNYLTVRIDKTASEILDDYHKATLIISFLSERLLKVGRTSAVRLGGDEL